VYALATEQERQTEALKNQKQNQLDRYRHVIQRQMEKERALLSFKKVEFLSRRETKLKGMMRPFSARELVTDSLPEIRMKGSENTKKNGRPPARNNISNLTPYLHRQRTHPGLRLISSTPANSSNSSPAETRKPSQSIATTGSNWSIAGTRTSNQNGRKQVQFERETKAVTRPALHQMKTSVTGAQKGIGNETFGKQGQNLLQKCDNIRNRATTSKRGQLHDNHNNKEKTENPMKPLNKGCDLTSDEKAEVTATKASSGQANWAVEARLIGLKMKFKRRQINGTFQAPELEVLDPSLKNERRACQEISNDPLKGVKGCRYLRMPNKNN